LKRTRDGEHRLPFHSGRGVKIPGSFGWFCGEEKREKVGTGLQGRETKDRGESSRLSLERFVGILLLVGRSLVGRLVIGGLVGHW
jgi:hypothetical protein